MNVKSDFSLKHLNTFGLEAKANYFAEFHNTAELAELLSKYKNEKLLVLGGGSNLLFTSDRFEGIVLHNKIKGIEVVEENDDTVILKAGAGEVWHSLVLYTIGKNWGGLENLSLIPGTVGAAPMQNIGAYGVELKDVFVKLEAYEIATGAIKIVTLEECNFGYRSSAFKHALKGKYIILSVTFHLSKKPVFHTSYGAITDTLTQMGLDVSVKNISDAVIHIRKSKLPDPQEIGNAGSFFKNPEVPVATFEKIKASYPTAPSFPASPGMIKVPAGWLIEQCGWKGKVVGHTGVHKNQALVLVNYGNAKGEEIRQLSIEVQKSVKEKFGIELEAEVNFI